MKIFKTILTTLLIVLSFNVGLSQTDDVYYSTKRDKEQYNLPTDTTTKSTKKNYYNVSNYDDYNYTSRIHRFYGDYSYGYYDPYCITNYYVYDPTYYTYWNSGWYTCNYSYYTYNGWGNGINYYNYRSYNNGYRNGYNNGYNDGYYDATYYNTQYYGKRNVTSSYNNQRGSSTVNYDRATPKSNNVRTVGYGSEIRNTSPKSHQTSPSNYRSVNNPRGGSVR